LSTKITREFDELIVSNLSEKWVTPKGLSKKIGVPWRKLMRAMPRLALAGRIQCRLVFIRDPKSRNRPQRQYRTTGTNPSMLEEIFGIRTFEKFEPTGPIKRHTLDDD
jgi:hypothetical protein